MTMGTNAIPRRENALQAFEKSWGELAKLQDPKIAQAFTKDGIGGVAKLFFTDSEYIGKEGQSLEGKLFHASGRNALAALDDVGHVLIGATEVLVGGVAMPIASIVGLFAALPRATQIAIHSAANGGIAFKEFWAGVNELDKHVQQMKKDGKWTEHEKKLESYIKLAHENKDAISRNWAEIKSQQTWKITSEAWEAFCTGFARMAETAPSAGINALQAVGQFAAGVGVAILRPIGIVLAEIGELATKAVGYPAKWLGEGLIWCGDKSHQAAVKLVETSPYAEIAGMGPKPAGKGLSLSAA